MPLHGLPLGSSQSRPVQQAMVGEHAWPIPGHVVEGWQVPLVAPGGMEHDRPVQQSPFTVQVAFCGWQSAGAWHVPLQMLEQQSAAVVQLDPLARQVPPASGRPPSVVVVPPSL